MSEKCPVCNCPMVETYLGWVCPTDNCAFRCSKNNLPRIAAAMNYALAVAWEREATPAQSSAHCKNREAMRISDVAFARMCKAKERLLEVFI